MKKSIFSLSILIASLTSCTKCYECRIIQTAPQEQGVQFQSIETNVEMCGMTQKQIDNYIQDMQSNTTVTIQGQDYQGSTRVKCN
jgi:predicted adenine nucleotide alpha hydrolase (AANH) superfamily ATPase